MTKEKDRAKAKKDDSNKGDKDDVKGDKAEKSKKEKSEKTEKNDKVEKVDKKDKKADKSAKTEKAVKVEKIDSDDDKKKKKKRKSSSSSSSPESKRESDVEVGPDEFLVKLDMSVKKGLGIEVDWANGKSLLVKSVKPEGHVPDWNREHTPDQQILSEDHVISVNGKAGDPKAMLNECRTSKKLKLLVWAHCVRSTEAPLKSSPKVAVPSKPDQRRLADAEAQLQESLARVQRRRRGVPEQPEHLVAVDMRKHTLLGLDVDWTSGKTLYIKSVLPGAIEEWNRACAPDRSVHPGDTVVAVNGYAGDARGMAGLCKELCTAQSQLHLRIRGPPFPPPNAPLKLTVA